MVFGLSCTIVIPVVWDKLPPRRIFMQQPAPAPAPAPAKKSNAVMIIIVVIVVLIICCVCIGLPLGYVCGDLISGGTCGL